LLGPFTTGLANPSSMPSSWQCGDPVNVGPTGSGMWGTNLSGNYKNSESSHLSSPAFSLAGCTGSIQLEVTHWYHFYDGASCTPFCDGGIFQISTDGGTTYNSMNAIQNGYTTGFWYVGSTYTPPNGEDGFHNRSGMAVPPVWLTSIWDLSAYGGQANMRFRFILGSNSALKSATAPGWYIDRVKIVAP
jgi:hypothetical protein